MKISVLAWPITSQRSVCNKESSTQASFDETIRQMRGRSQRKAQNGAATAANRSHRHSLIVVWSLDGDRFVVVGCCCNSRGRDATVLPCDFGAGQCEPRTNPCEYGPTSDRFLAHSRVVLATRRRVEGLCPRVSASIFLKTTCWGSLPPDLRDSLVLQQMSPTTVL